MLNSRNKLALQKIAKSTTSPTVSYPAPLKREFFTQKISSYAGDVKGSWKVINQVLNKKSKTTHVSSLNVDGKTILDNAAIAESMHDFFCDISKKLSDKIPATLNPLLANEYSVNKENSKFHFTRGHTSG